MDLGPGFDESPLCPRELTADHLNGIDSEDRGRILVVRVEVRSMVGASGSANILMMIP